MLAVCLVVVVLRFTAGLNSTSLWGAVTGTVFVILQYWGPAYFEKRRSASLMVKALITSLLRIAERHPSPQLAPVVGELKEVAQDVLQQDKETRQTSREVAERLEGLTRQIKDLPVASGPYGDERALPRPAVEPGPEAETLPRVCS